MYNLYWIGANESEIEFCNNLFTKSITINGSGKKNNISYSNIYNKRINYNSSVHENEIGAFFKNEINNILKNDNNARFMFYSQYNAYYYGKEVREKTICINEKAILDKLKNKIEAHKYIGENTNVTLLPYKILKGAEISIKKLNSLFNSKRKEYVIQGEYSDGGDSTFVVNNVENIREFVQHESIYSISPYIENSISTNVNIIIYEDDIEIFPASIQIIKKTSDKLVYFGADYVAYNCLSQNIKNKINQSTKEIAGLLQKDGFRGICGIDYLTDKDNVYFMEVNERFQASSYLLNLTAHDEGLPSLQERCIKAFDKARLNKKEIIDSVPYSTLYYCNNGFSKELYFLFNKLSSDNYVYKVTADGYKAGINTEENAYLFKSVFNNKICGILPEYRITIWDNLTGLFNVNTKNVEDIKIALLCCGLNIRSIAFENITKSGGVCDSISNGINITIFNNVTVGCMTQNTPGVSLSPFSLDFDDEHGYVLTYFNTFVSKVKLQMKQSIMKKVTKLGTPYRAIGFLALDRLGINYRANCTFCESKAPCKFCGVYQHNNEFKIEEIYEVIDEYIKSVDFRHFLIGGPTHNNSSDYHRITKIAEYISQKTSKAIYLMSLPIDNKDQLLKLKELGITEVSFNIEIFNRTVAKKIMPGKGTIPIKQYYTALKYATEIWGKNGNVRSMLVVGLEEESSLLNGIKKLASMGVTPILSPFGPSKGSAMESEIPPNYQYFKNIYIKSKKICGKYGIKLGPTCDYCKNNTLSINETSQCF